ncbi:hypothetical protein HK405_012057 [Cladochytrium tenue]|nr:hypothetical protein HK405_012057 [Cladochytrium tenue]
MRSSSPERKRSKSFSVARTLQDRRGSFADDGLAHELGDAAYRSRGRILHPVWDSENPSGTAQQLYGPLIATVRDLSMAASGSVAAAAAPSNQEGQLTALPPAPSLAYRPGATSAARRRNLAVRSRSVTIDTRPTLAVVAAAAPEPASSVDSGSSSSRHTSRAICHALTSPFPKTRYRVGWDARATAALRWALPDRLLDWGFALASARQDTKEKEKDRDQ